MLFRRFTDFILRGRLEACAVAFSLAFFPLIGGMSILIAGLVTIRKGPYEGALIVLAATLPAVLSTYSVPPHSLHADFACMALAVIAMSNFTTWLLAVLLRRYNNWNVIFEFVLLVSIMVIGLVHIIYPDIQIWWGEKFAFYLDKVASYLHTLAPAADGVFQLPVWGPEIEAEVINFFKSFATGLFVGGIVSSALLQLILVRWWQGQFFTLPSLAQELQHIRLDKISSMLFVVCFMFSLLGNATLLDILPIFYAMFAMAGLSLMHCALTKTRLWWLWLGLIYTALTLVFTFSAGLLAIVGLLDTWVNFRKWLV